MKRQFDIEVINYFGSNEGAALSSSPLDMPVRSQRALYFPRMGVPGFDWKMNVSRKIQTRLVDIDNGQDIDTGGQIGELRFKGPTIFSGYFKAPELTARAFDEQGFYRTGDLFEIAGDRNQYYRYAGRHKDIVIRGGMNISSEEIEGLIMSHPQVRDAAVIGAPDATMGERVCAVVVLQPGQKLSLQDLVDHFKRVNDEHGHTVGDQVLFQAARRTQRLAWIAGALLLGVVVLKLFLRPRTSRSSDISSAKAR